jgi:HAD superfamily hydrolase (TIGR01549 family)
MVMDNVLCAVLILTNAAGENPAALLQNYRKIRKMREDLNIKHICFDLDGTLTDSLDTIYKATLKTLRLFNINNPPGMDDLKYRVGYHFKEIFHDLKIPVQDVNHFINIYKQHYFDYISDTKVYPGVAETLNYLKESGYLISLLTTKAQDQTERIIEHFGLSGCFNVLMGGRPGIAVKPSLEPLIKICEELNIPAGNTLMVGDADIDVSCGKNAGAFTCAVLYGYRKKEQLLELKPDFVVEQMPEIISFLNRK